MSFRHVLLLALVTGPISSASGQNAEAVRLPSPGKAQTLSILSTLVPMAAGGVMLAAGVDGGVSAIVAGTGAVLGPSIGFFYGGSTGRGVGGILIRGAAGLVGALGYCMEVCDDDVVEGSVALMVAGGAVMAASIGFDLLTVKSSTADRNTRKQAPSTVSLAPTVFRGGRPGLILRAAF